MVGASAVKSRFFSSTDNVLGDNADSKKYRIALWSTTVRQRVEEMLGSSVVSQISAEELTFAANFIASRNFRNFEVYFVTTIIYLGLAIGLRQVFRLIGRYVLGAKS